MADKMNTTNEVGIEALRALGYKQADYARMFDVDPATVHQWYRLGRIGARSVARVEHIRELSKRLTIAQLRPDLDDDQIAIARLFAKLWARKRRAVSK